MVGIDLLSAIFRKVPHPLPTQANHYSKIHCVGLNSLFLIFQIALSRQILSPSPGAKKPNPATKGKPRLGYQPLTRESEPALLRGTKAGPDRGAELKQAGRAVFLKLGQWFARLWRSAWVCHTNQLILVKWELLLRPSSGNISWIAMK